MDVSVPCLDPRREGLAPVRVVPATSDDGHVHFGGRPSRRGVLPPERGRGFTGVGSHPEVPLGFVILSEVGGGRGAAGRMEAGESGSLDVAVL